MENEKKHYCHHNTEDMRCETVEVHEELIKIVNEKMPDEEELYDLAELFKVFGDSTRIRILFVLLEAEVCVCDSKGAVIVHLLSGVVIEVEECMTGRAGFQCHCLSLVPVLL